jgi:hypothetical protein
MPPHRHSDLNIVRDTLVSRTPGVELRAGGVLATVSSLPLFRRAENGSLEQAVRVRIESAGPVSGAVLSIYAGDRIVDRQTVDLAQGRSAFDLFVPEVHVPAMSVAELALPGRESARAELLVEPQRKWTIHLVHHSHFDYGYTDPQATVMEHQLKYIDAALDLIAETDDWHESAKFRWNIEVTYPLHRWFASRPPALHAELIERIKQGRIEASSRTSSASGTGSRSTPRSNPTCRARPSVC